MRTIYSTMMILLIQFTTLLAMAPTPGKGSQQQGGGMGSMLILFLPLLIIWWFLLIRPQQKKEKDRQKMLSQLNKGEQILTIGGIFGEIVQVKEDRVTIKIADKINIEVSKSAISQKITK